MKYKIDPSKFATVLTSGGRFDLLGETVASFQRHFDVERILIAEDSEDSASAAAFARAFPVADVRVNLPKLGQMRSIDAHYANLSAPYVVHLEDDWAASTLADDWLVRAVDVLASEPDVGQVRLRRADECVLAHHMLTGEPIRWRGDGLKRRADAAHFTFNPSLLRAADVRRLLPWASEADAQRRFLDAGFATVQLLPGVFRHLGAGRSLRGRHHRGPIIRPSSRTPRRRPAAVARSTSR